MARDSYIQALRGVAIAAVVLTVVYGIQYFWNGRSVIFS